MKYCQGVKCHTYRTKDRIRGTKGQKHYATRRRTHLLFGLFCSQRCEYDWVEEYAERAIDYFGRVIQAKRTDCDNAWYKDRDWRQDNAYYFINDLLGQRIPITQQQYDDDNLVRP
jgi:hypothetical protein